MEKEAGGLRIALTLQGAVSLGTFGAGAVAALVTAVQEVQKTDPDAVSIDVIAGASSGSLTGLLAAYALMTGEDALPALRYAWVTAPTVQALTARDDRAPLSLWRAEEVGEEVFGKRRRDDATPQETGITLDMALSSLRGFEYEIERWAPEGEERPSLNATSYLDRSTFQFKPEAARRGTIQWKPVLDAALASASHPVAFPPELLDREDLRKEYEFNRVTNHPPDAPLTLWYTDGGVLDNQPLGRCLDLVAEAPAGEQRLVLVIRPDPDVPPGAGDPAWTGRGKEPLWLETIQRSIGLVKTQSLYDDVRRAEKTNARLEWTEMAADVISGLLAGDEPAARTRLTKDVLDRIEKAKRALPRHQPSPELEQMEAMPLEELVRHVIRTVAGLQDKLPVRIEVVTADRGHRFGGHALGEFGGFLAESLRDEAFCTGYREMVEWMSDRDRGLRANGLTAPQVRAALRAAERSDPEAARAARLDGLRVTPGTALALAKLVVRTARIATREAWTLLNPSKG